MGLRAVRTKIGHSLKPIMGGAEIEIIEGAIALVAELIEFCRLR
jgi:hypothetical protein